MHTTPCLVWKGRRRIPWIPSIPYSSVTRTRLLANSSYSQFCDENYYVPTQCCLPASVVMEKHPVRRIRQCCEGEKSSALSTRQYCERYICTQYYPYPPVLAVGNTEHVRVRVSTGRHTGSTGTGHTVTAFAYF